MTTNKQQHPLTNYSQQRHPHLPSPTPIVDYSLVVLAMAVEHWAWSTGQLVVLPCALVTVEEPLLPGCFPPTAVAALVSEAMQAQPHPSHRHRSAAATVVAAPLAPARPNPGNYNNNQRHCFSSSKSPPLTSSSISS